MAKALVDPSFGPSTGPPHPGSRGRLREEHLTGKRAPCQLPGRS